MDDNTWYDNPLEMLEDDKVLQSILVDLRNDMDIQNRKLIEEVHVYPSKSCTYTLDKSRVFVRMRDDQGNLLPRCALRHVILHELAHIANKRSVGHDSGFWAWLGRLGAGVDQCPEKIPKRFNTCH